MDGRKEGRTDRRKEGRTPKWRYNKLNCWGSKTGTTLNHNLHWNADNYYQQSVWDKPYLWQDCRPYLTPGLTMKTCIILLSLFGKSSPWLAFYVRNILRYTVKHCIWTCSLYFHNIKNENKIKYCKATCICLSVYICLKWNELCTYWYVLLRCTF